MKYRSRVDLVFDIEIDNGTIEDARKAVRNILHSLEPSINILCMEGKTNELQSQNDKEVPKI